MIAVRRIAGFLAFAILSAGPSTASAASITSFVTKEGKVVISLKGEIAEGDVDGVKSIIKSANDGGRRVSGIRLESPGGNILEATKLAEIIRFGRIAAVVPNGVKCASACFIVFAAGDPKYVSYSAFVGVHGASDESGRETVEAGAATVTMAKIVKNLGVPSSIIGKMVVTPPDQIVWLTPDDLRSMGTTMTGKPAQVPPSQSADGGQPMQLNPNAKAAIPPASANNEAPTWKQFIEKAMALSAQQNGGKPLLNRACQPELKLCNMAIFFKLNGHDMMVRRSEDDTGKMVSRDLCDFNDFGDVRTCVDWDSGTKIREMKNSRGEWITIGN